MCGIFTLLNADGSNNELILSYIQEQFKKGERRGPEFSTMQSIMIKALFGFHRLAINGVNKEANQPLHHKDVSLICNGEIYNYKELYDMMNIKPNTDSDCEVILHLYLKYGIEQALNMIDGVFAFALIDKRVKDGNCHMYIARDPYGVRPLYWLKPTKKCKANLGSVYGFASEVKSLYGIYSKLNKVYNPKPTLSLLNGNKPLYTIKQFTPGSYMTYSLPFAKTGEWKFMDHTLYHHTGFHSIMFDQERNTNDILQNIRTHLSNAVKKRCITTERPIACLLSGGLDSSLIAALVNEYHKEHKLPQLETYSIGLEGATDLVYAKEVAEYLGTKHTTIVLSEDEFLNVIPDVIADIESYDTTTIRASIGNWLIGKYISEHSEAKVIFNGDGSDELAGGYLYMKYAKDSIEFDKECRRLLTDIHTFDVLRSDKCISSHGLEPRTPFLDRGWVEYYLSIPHKYRYGNKDEIEKNLIRKAFSPEYFLNSEGSPLLPTNVLWRRKEAFSDGVSNETRSLYTIIQEYTDKIVRDELNGIFDFFNQTQNTSIEDISKIHPDMALINDHLEPQTSEQLYYRQCFEKQYPGLGKIIPYFWMPKYVKTNDASARTLDIYNQCK